MAKPKVTKGKKSKKTTLNATTAWAEMEQYFDRVVAIMTEVTEKYEGSPETAGFFGVAAGNFVAQCLLEVAAGCKDEDKAKFAGVMGAGTFALENAINKKLELVMMPVRVQFIGANRDPMDSFPPGTEGNSVPGNETVN